MIRQKASRSRAKKIQKAKPLKNKLHITKKSINTSQSRNLHIHEYQSKEILARAEIPTTQFIVASTPEEVEAGTKKLLSQGAKKIAVKSQIHAGGRGKGYFKESMFQGGVHLTSDPLKAKELSKNMLGYHLITKQTDHSGQLVSKLLLEPTVNVTAEKYLAIIMDRKSKGPILLVSPKGGMNIEEVAHNEPSAIKKILIDINRGISDEQAKEAVDFLGSSSNDEYQNNIETIKKLYTLFSATDSTQIEINPLAVDENGKYVCIDAKLNFDDSAAYRQKDIFKLRDNTMEDPREVEATKSDLNYIGLDGRIGCLVNGAGLAMATLDILKLNGGSAANFLDVGGGATEQQVTEAFKLITSDPNVDSILVNIFGGIMHCDILARGIIAAAKNIQLKVPLIVRLEGTNSKQGAELLEKSGLSIISAKSLEEAAIKAVQASNEARKH